MAEEIFGPILPVLTVGGLDEAMRFVAERPKPLALYGFTESAAVQQRLVEETSSGGVTINHAWMHISVHDLPFGGVGGAAMRLPPGAGNRPHHVARCLQPSGRAGPPQSEPSEIAGVHARPQAGTFLDAP